MRQVLFSIPEASRHGYQCRIPLHGEGDILHRTLVRARELGPELLGRQMGTKQPFPFITALLVMYNCSNFPDYLRAHFDTNRVENRAMLGRLEKT